ncbi:MAG TPA: PBP1A family penicillin-binding protein [Vicinamibacterales bacterium]|nr:PBP1A family penicillin-binding protein [Vicinamibacterales bacterium]
MTPPSPWKRWIARFSVVILFVIAAALGTAGGVLFAFADDLPAISALDDYSPGTITRVLGRDGSVVGEFATERRQVVTYEDIPAVLRNAIISAEDDEFMTHGGIHPLLMGWAAVNDVLSRRRTPGRSTITQQLARQLFPEAVGFERVGTAGRIRKIKEALVALQIEKRYSKQEILTMYCNKVAWGNRAFGVEAASRLYFGKPAKELTLGEAATIAGMLPAPQRFNPYASMEASTRRRNYTLDRMAEEGYITRDEAVAEKAKPIVTRGQPAAPQSIAPYLVESLRVQLEERYGAKTLYEGGLVIKTGLDPALQRAAHQALDEGLRRLDKARGFRKPVRNVIEEKRTLDSFRHPRWNREIATGDIVPALVTDVEAGVIRVRAGRLTGTIAKPGYAWTKRRAEELVKAGDLVEVKVGKAKTDGVFEGELEQAPLLEGAVVAIDNRTGAILAMEGGSSFERSQFNRAVQAKRQVGSLFKPFVYMAALDKGYTAMSQLDDSPVSFDVGPGQPPYEPKNYDHEYKGPITLRRALELSRNVPAVAMMQTLGPAQVIEYPRKLGITTPIPEFLSVAIGAAEGTLLEMTSAYSALPNQGVRLTPLLFSEVTDREGNILERHRPEPHESIRADTAYLVTELLHGVMEHGTGANANTAALKWPVGGKTGTTDDYTDAWFIGFDAEITIGVWIGYDQKKPIGSNATGTTVALPIWTSIMKSWVDRRRQELPAPPEFQRPGNVIVVNTAAGPEFFISGTEPIIKRPN